MFNISPLHSIKTVLLTVCFYVLTLCGVSGAEISEIYRRISPDKLTLLKLGKDNAGQLYYAVSIGQKPKLDWSRVGIVIDGQPSDDPRRNYKISTSDFAETFTWSLGENDKIENRYSSISVKYTAGHQKVVTDFRVFNNSIAIRYIVSDTSLVKGHRVSQERTEFNFPMAYTLYQYNEESVYSPVELKAFSGSCDFPATLAGEESYICIGEADNHNYTKAELVKGEKLNSLAVTYQIDSLHAYRKSATRSDLPLFDVAVTTPWRTISFSPTAIGLHEFSDLNLKLSPPSGRIQASSVRPGKLMRAQLNTQSGIDCVNFAAAHNFQYIMFDAGWYGAEFRSSSDPTKVIPGIDMDKVIAYGKQKGIGVILYVNYVGLRQKIDTILPLYKKWGVSGLKFGFVDGLNQKGIAWLDTAIRKVNDYGLILDIHDNYKPTGLSRTYPFLLTQEGVRGDENSPDAFHTTTLPFTRFLAGAADFTFCYPNARSNFSKNLKVTKAHQLALSVIYFSPLQSMFWYGQPNDYIDEQEIEFFKEVPTVWNETKYIKGEIGKGVIVARRQGDLWYIGCAAGPEDWQQKIRFDFLSGSKVYQAIIYSDDGHGGIDKKTLTLRSKDQYQVDLKSAGGQAMIIKELR